MILGPEACTKTRMSSLRLAHDLWQRRYITVPLPELKTLQKAIQYQLLLPIPLSPTVYSDVRRLSATKTPDSISAPAQRRLDRHSLLLPLHGDSDGHSEPVWASQPLELPEG